MLVCVCKNSMKYCHIVKIISKSCYLILIFSFFFFSEVTRTKSGSKEIGRANDITCAWRCGYHLFVLIILISFDSIFIFFIAKTFHLSIFPSLYWDTLDNLSWLWIWKGKYSKRHKEAHFLFHMHYKFVQVLHLF